jgi:Protein of unknown function (DUF2892)
VTQVTDRGRTAAHTVAEPPDRLRGDKEQVMKTNEGATDRALRVIGGGVLVGLAATGTIGMWGLIGLVPLATGLVGWCPAYSLLGIDTCPVRAK